jgi:large subunit ribosomal protein L27
MAHKKAMGSTSNGRDSQAKRLGVKIYGGQPAIAGNIIIRQKGNKFWPSTGVDQGRVCNSRWYGIIPGKTPSAF